MIRHLVYIVSCAAKALLALGRNELGITSQRLDLSLDSLAGDSGNLLTQFDCVQGMVALCW